MNRTLLCFVFLFTLQISAQEQPNIIFILIDDQRYDFLSFLDHPWIETPHIDKLAENSFYFDEAFVTTSLCSPSRASILTGLYAHSHAVIDNDTPLPTDLPTFPIELQKAGYHTAFVGKWHMGGDNDMPRKGFDHWVSFKGQGKYFDPQLNVDGNQVSKQGYTPDILTDFVVDYLKTRKNSDQPYCLFLSHKSIHENFSPAPRHKGKYADQEIPLEDVTTSKGLPQWTIEQVDSWHGSKREFPNSGYRDYQRFFQLYSECMLGVDESVGRVTSYLEKNGELENTVIIYFSDNGYMMGEKALIDKRVMYEESIRVPAFIHWPEKLSATRNDAFFLNIDIAPTILDIAGVAKPETMHGESILPIVMGSDTSWRQDFIYEYFIDPNAVQTPTIFGLRTKRYSYMTYHGVWDLFELYDMEADPKQRYNLVGEISYGWGYGPFLRYVNRQLPDLYPAVKELDDRLTELMATHGGSRVPKWTEK